MADSLVPFPRKPCECSLCVGACRDPGYLIPTDLERLGIKTADDARGWIRASMNYAVAVTGGYGLLRALVPTVNAETKVCRWMDKDNRCTVHDVAPFGCAYFNACERRAVVMAGTDEMKKQWSGRVMWGFQLIEGAWKRRAAGQPSLYAELWHELWNGGHRCPFNDIAKRLSEAKRRAGHGPVSRPLVPR